jgi:hypothetical protein
MASNITFREDGTILINGVRLSYPHLFKAWAGGEDQEAKFSGKFWLDKKTHKDAIVALNKHLQALQQEWFKGRIPSDKLFFKDGAASGKDEEAGQFIVSASEKVRPTVINRDKSPVTEADDIVYAGCFVNVLIRPWKQANKFGKRINANLLAVQFVRDGERFTGVDRPDVDDVFEDESGGVEGAEGGDDEFGLD